MQYSIPCRGISKATIDETERLQTLCKNSKTRHQSQQPLLLEHSSFTWIFLKTVVDGNFWCHFSAWWRQLQKLTLYQDWPSSPWIQTTRNKPRAWCNGNVRVHNLCFGRDFKILNSFFNVQRFTANLVLNVQYIPRTDRERRRAWKKILMWQ